MASKRQMDDESHEEFLAIRFDVVLPPFSMRRGARYAYHCDAEKPKTQLRYSEASDLFGFLQVFAGSIGALGTITSCSKDNQIDCFNLPTTEGCELVPTSFA